MAKPKMRPGGKRKGTRICRIQSSCLFIFYVWWEKPQALVGWRYQLSSLARGAVSKIGGVTLMRTTDTASRAIKVMGLCTEYRVVVYTSKCRQARPPLPPPPRSSCGVHLRWCIALVVPGQSVPRQLPRLHVLHWWIQTVPPPGLCFQPAASLTLHYYVPSTRYQRYARIARNVAIGLLRTPPQCCNSKTHGGECLMTAFHFVPSDAGPIGIHAAIPLESDL